jgi:hypothetical protein
MSDLTVSDPLAEQEVAVVVRVLPDNAQRPARTALVSVGTAGQPPAFASGTLDEVADLIRQAWLAYGVRAEVRQPATGDVTAVAETVAEAVMGGAAEIPALAPAQMESQAAPVQPRPPNLSLF